MLIGELSAEGGELTMARPRKASFPRCVRVVACGVDGDGYPRGGLRFEDGRELPGGVYGFVHAAEWLLGEGWPAGTVLLMRVEGEARDRFRPMTLLMAAGTADGLLRLKRRAAL